MPYPFDIKAANLAIGIVSVVSMLLLSGCIGGDGYNVGDHNGIKRPGQFAFATEADYNHCTYLIDNDHLTQRGEHKTWDSSDFIDTGLAAGTIVDLRFCPFVIVIENHISSDGAIKVRLEESDAKKEGLPTNSEWWISYLACER